MSSNHPRRERASSDRSQRPPSALPQRPSLQSRTISAPAGGLYKLFPTSSTDPANSKPGKPAIAEEEDEDANASAKSHRPRPSDESALPRMTIAIVGGDNAGKTTFIRSALDLKSAPSSRSTTKKMSLDGSIYLVCLLEIPSSEVGLDDGRIVWPRLGERSSIDGVLVLHDMTQPPGFARVRRLLDALAASPLPFVVAVSKNDPQTEAQDPVSGNYDLHKAPPDSPRSQKFCISLVLRSAISHKTENTNPNPPAESARTSPVTSPAQSHHVRAASENPTTLFSADSDGHGGCRPTETNPSTSSFLDMEDDKDEPSGALSPEAPLSPDPNQKPNEPVHEAGFALDELVDRLVSKPNPEPESKSDSKFQSIFLCLYRKFARPSSLLNSLIGRFERNERTATDQLVLNFDQSRVFNILGQWVRDYPGDLAHPRTRKRLIDFITALERSPFYMFYAKEVSASFDLIVDDEDESWPYGDADMEESNSSTETFFDNSGRSSPSLFLSGTTAENREEEEEDPLYNMNSLDLSENPPEGSSNLSSSSLVDKPGTIMSQEYTPVTLEGARKDAQNLELTPRLPLLKLQWRQFMDFPDDDFAEELTRIDWIMYSSFRPRDLVQHVSISGPDKEKIKNLTHVNRMIKQFNHLATFVASMILLRDKPKHRSRALEKFMNIALKLRRQNNYNSLGAVIAGINGTPVQRLSQTWALIPPLTEKEFLRQVILMETHGSHGRYRLAWDNTPKPRIPFLPLHRRDLVSAEEGNRTFVGSNRSRINWRKFEVMGDIVVKLQLSQQQPYEQLHQFHDIERLVLDIKLPTDEEDLYARSMHVEPTGSGAERKMFGWLRQ